MKGMFVKGNCGALLNLRLKTKDEMKNKKQKTSIMQRCGWSRWIWERESIREEEGEKLK